MTDPLTSLLGAWVVFRTYISQVTKIQNSKKKIENGIKDNQYIPVATDMMVKWHRKF
jgi:hypothetical protein